MIGIFQCKKRFFLIFKNSTYQIIIVVIIVVIVIIVIVIITISVQIINDIHNSLETNHQKTYETKRRKFLAWATWICSTIKFLLNNFRYIN